MKIEELQELSRKENKTNLNLLRALQCKKHLTTLSSDCDSESYIDAAYSTVESIKIIASTLSPKSGQNLMEASFTPTPLEKLKNFTIPRREDLPPDSIRNETSPSTVWHSNNFPRNGAKEHYTIGCIRDPKENGVYSKKQSTNDKAVDDTDGSLRATETNEITQTNNKTK